MQQIADKQVYSVSEVNYFAKQTLEQLELWVMGEITTFKKNPNWRFFYLDLKDQSALLPCIADGSVFKDMAEDLTGQKILAFGFLSLYEARGQYQFKIQKIEAVGDGILQKQLEELIKKLKGEGLFDAEHKQAIPVYPKKVCVVTSNDSDAWNDFKRHTIDKFPIIELTTIDVRVQGAKSVPQLLEILPKVDKQGFDVVVITRGGGSLEDLTAFNNEAVARAIFGMKTPTIVAIGHEANESLAEWVADRRASTPTDAANIVTQGYNQALEKLNHQKLRMLSKLNYFSSSYFQRLDGNYRRLLHMKTYYKDLPHILYSCKQKLKQNEKVLITDAFEKLGLLTTQIGKNVRMNLSTKEQNLREFQKALHLLSPENTLARGYAIVTGADGKVAKSINTIVVEGIIGVKLIDGSFSAVVKNKK